MSQGMNSTERTANRPTPLANTRVETLVDALDDPTVYPGRKQHDAVAIIETDTDWIVISERGEAITLERGGECPQCDHDSIYKPRMGEAELSVYIGRRKEGCRHREAKLERADIDPAQCPTCHSYQIEETRLMDGQQWVKSEYHCAQCGEPRGEREAPLF